MNGKQAKKLRKQAGGNTADYDIDTRVKTIGVTKEGKTVNSTTLVATLKYNCTRSAYKKLKSMYKAK